MSIKEQVELIALDDYKDRTGDYRANKIPTLFDFFKPKVPSAPEIHYPASVKKYGIDKYEYWRLQKAQNNRCAVCGELPKHRALHLDHCHTTNKIRGLVCHHCNIAIGMIKEDAQTARAIADYLEKHQIS